MSTDSEVSVALVRAARWLLADQVKGVSLPEALDPGAGARSSLGVLKHIAGWAWVYWSYAFEAKPQHWDALSWPRGLRDTIDVSPEYLAEVIAWADAGIWNWENSLATIAAGEMSQPRPLHWGGTAPLDQVVTLAMQHITYHAGEINMLLSIRRREAWEWGEEVEENHLDTFEFGVRPPWMTPEQLRTAQAERDARRSAARRGAD